MATQSRNGCKHEQGRSSKETVSTEYEENCWIDELVFSDVDLLKPAGIFTNEAVSADLLRLIVVFLHATFEVLLRSKTHRQTKSFYSRTDIDKALKQAGIDAEPFKDLYPPLTQMAKRRKRIVHDADLSESGASVLEAWNVVDYWQLIMWNLAVVAFYYQILISTNAANKAELEKYRDVKEAMTSHISFGNQLVAFSTMPEGGRGEALKRIVDTLNSMIATLTRGDPAFLNET
jgi:hypothetical protein